MGEFIDLYQEYKNLFDQENMLRVGRTTYAEVEKKAAEREIIVEFQRNAEYNKRKGKQIPGGDAI